MKNNYLLLLLLSLFGQIAVAQTKQEPMTKFEQTKGAETVTYEEGIAYLQKLATQFATIQLQSIGTTDIGKPLHLAIFSLDKDFKPESLKRKGRNVFMINNAIHPGEPDGVDASLMLFRDLATQPKLQAMAKNTVFIMVPFFNVGGALNRSSYSRVNQNGPKAYGFRGNSRNLNLNRDFIKLDAQNTHTFVDIFQRWNPDIYIENHVSNGADYQHVLTYLATQADKLGGVLGSYLRKQMIPDLKKTMKANNWDIIPYVNVYGNRTPNQFGIPQFFDSPRYSSGYTTLFHSLGFINETHMLKPFKQRVNATYDFMVSMVKHLHENGAKIKIMRAATASKVTQQKNFTIGWQRDKTKFEKITFKGYTPQMIPSKFTGQKRLFYDRNKPVTQQIKYYNVFNPTLTVKAPKAYIISQAWNDVVTLLKKNGVVVKQLTKDQQVKVDAYYITDYKSFSQPFEGHYVHYNTKVKIKRQTVRFYKNDYVVFVNQSSNRYIIETLEPQATDSFFSWNFFDTILQQKEGFSSYVFEDIAEKLLRENADLRKRFEIKRKESKAFRESAYQQLNFIYQNSLYYEKEHMRYPVFRFEGTQSLEVK
ncbi:M14 family metallopeptidase [Microscilla marina]|uniref:Peptidase M14 domain-containing protein n=1 Tax=Microscilla marina ATCC 23134 TaxID=313606 RepID=A1ZV10_MICM2|nr:M14 family metallopeptidase [Microscilla marina]EAY25788.1 conserved hypothetical protein [Microscilla marina ATCC 23134]